MFLPRVVSTDWSGEEGAKVLLAELVKCQPQAAHTGRASPAPLPPLFALTTGTGRQEKGKGKEGKKA